MHDRNLASRARHAAPLILSLLLATPGASAEVVGQVLFTMGDVRIADGNGVTRPARRGDLIQDGERIITGQGAMGQVKTPAGARIGIRPDSNLQFQPRAAGAQTMALSGGAVRLVNTDGTGPLRLQTPQGEVSVRDADALAGVLGGDAAGQGATRTVVKLNRGQGETRSRSGIGENIGTGEALSMSAARPAPQRLASADVPELTSRPFQGSAGAPVGDAFKAPPVKSPKPLSPALPRPAATGLRSPTRTLPVKITPRGPVTGTPGPRIPPVLQTLDRTGKGPGLEIPDGSGISGRGVIDVITSATLSRKPAPTTSPRDTLTLPTRKGEIVTFDPRAPISGGTKTGGPVVVKRGG